MAEESSKASSMQKPEVPWKVPLHAMLTDSPSLLYGLKDLQNTDKDRTLSSGWNSIWAFLSKTRQIVASLALVMTLQTSTPASLHLLAKVQLSSTLGLCLQV